MMVIIYTNRTQTINGYIYIYIYIYIFIYYLSALIGIHQFSALLYIMWWSMEEKGEGEREIDLFWV